MLRGSASQQYLHLLVLTHMIKLSGIYWYLTANRVHGLCLESGRGTSAAWLRHGWTAAWFQVEMDVWSYWAAWLRYTKYSTAVKLDVGRCRERCRWDEAPRLNHPR